MEAERVIVKLALENERLKSKLLLIDSSNLS